MKNLIVCLIFFLSINSGISQAQEDRFKVLTYNIWNGFDWGKDVDRRAALQQWVKAQNSDVIGLQELCAYTPEKLQEDAESWGHNYSVLLKTTGYSVGITSKYPIALKEKIIDGMHHGALHCKIKDVDFLVIHLHPGSIKRRREEVKILSNKLLEIEKTNPKFIVLGDFNAHSPFDADLYDVDGALMQRAQASNQGKGLDGNIEHSVFDYAVMSGFISFPLYDVTSLFTNGMGERGSFPGKILGTKSKETAEELEARLNRIDYIMVSDALVLKCTGSSVHNGAENWMLSDHYPVSASFSN